jgi:hypothetical protein
MYATLSSVTGAADEAVPGGVGELVDERDGSVAAGAAVSHAPSSAARSRAATVRWIVGATSGRWALAVESRDRPPFGRVGIDATSTSSTLRQAPEADR